MHWDDIKHVNAVVNYVDEFNDLKEITLFFGWGKLRTLDKGRYNLTK